MLLPHTTKTKAKYCWGLSFQFTHSVLIRMSWSSEVCLFANCCPFVVLLHITNCLVGIDVLCKYCGLDLCAPFKWIKCLWNLIYSTASQNNIFNELNEFTTIFTTSLISVNIFKMQNHKSVFWHQADPVYIVRIILCIYTYTLMVVIQLIYTKRVHFWFDCT